MYMTSFLDMMDSEERTWFEEFNKLANINFIAAMLINFFVEHHYKNSILVERELSKLIAIYLQGRFVLDLVAVLPLMDWAQYFLPL